MQWNQQRMLFMESGELELIPMLKSIYLIDLISRPNYLSLKPGYQQAKKRKDCSMNSPFLIITKYAYLINIICLEVVWLPILIT